MQNTAPISARELEYEKYIAWLHGREDGRRECERQLLIDIYDGKYKDIHDLKIGLKARLGLDARD